jgi:hypothetical protein
MTSDKEHSRSALKATDHRHTANCNHEPGTKKAVQQHQGGKPHAGKRNLQNTVDAYHRMAGLAGLAPCYQENRNNIKHIPQCNNVPRQVVPDKQPSGRQKTLDWLESPGLDLFGPEQPSVSGESKWEPNAGSIVCVPIPGPVALWPVDGIPILQQRNNVDLHETGFSYQYIARSSGAGESIPMTQSPVFQQATHILNPTPNVQPSSWQPYPFNQISRSPNNPSSSLPMRTGTTSQVPSRQVRDDPTCTAHPYTQQGDPPSRSTKDAEGRGRPSREKILKFDSWRKG